jgi:D-serine deaminase-like pyridoxal phosphate-dependent protein
MSTELHEAGTSKSEIETPALLIDLPTMEKNIQTMAQFFRGAKAKLRPHVKLHKGTPALAQLQVGEGTVGVTCAKLSEAEAVATAGIRDILIANQIVGSSKIRRLMALAKDANVIVAVDDDDNISQLSQAAASSGIKLRVLVEVNIGNNRCGVAPLGPALELARVVYASPGLTFSGLMGYDGHCKRETDASIREVKALEANQLLVDTRNYIERAGLDVEIVSASGTFTYKFACELEGITEIQAGTYLLMDTGFRDRGVTDFECALTVLATVISRPSWVEASDLAILDVGRKGIDLHYGLPTVKSPSGCELFSMAQEHGMMRLNADAQGLRVGDKVELWVRDANGTINMYEKFYAIRKEIVEAVWHIPTVERAT